MAGVYGERKAALLRKIMSWRQLQYSHMPGVQVLIGQEDQEAEETDDVDIQPLTVKMFLPSQLSAVPPTPTQRSDRDRYASDTLARKELDLRRCHAGAALSSLRRAIRIKINIYRAKDANVRGQRDGTRASSVLASYQQKVQLAADI